MKKSLFSLPSIAVLLGTGLLFSLFHLGIKVEPADAGCYRTGRYAGGMPVLRCSGRTRCRATGRYKVVRGVRYQIMSCPR